MKKKITWKGTPEKLAYDRAYTEEYNKRELARRAALLEPEEIIVKMAAIRARLGPNPISGWTPAESKINEDKK